MGKFIDLIGISYGRLKVVERLENNIWNQATWKCICECGKEVTVDSGRLRKGNTKSCGCFKKDETIRRHTIHGHARNKNTSPEFSIWAVMVQRCTNQNNKDFHHYGGRGITVAREWLESFEQFLADVGERPSSKHSLDRKCNDKGYTPDNCRWATMTEQARNRRVSKTNKTGISGVFWSERLQKYTVTIAVNGKLKHIGCTESLEQARSMREDSELKYWGKSS